MDLVRCTMRSVHCDDDRTTGGQQCGLAMYWRGDGPVGSTHGAFVCERCDMMDDTAIGLPPSPNGGIVEIVAGPPVVHMQDDVSAYRRPGWGRHRPVIWDRKKGGPLP